VISAKRLYVADFYTDIIYSMDYEGEQLSRFYTDDGANLMDVQYADNYVYYTGWSRT